MHICYNGEQQQQRQGDELVVPGPVLVVEDPLALLLVVHIAADKRTGSIQATEGYLLAYFHSYIIK